MNYGKAHPLFQPNVLCNEVKMKLHLNLTLLFVFSINSGPCRNINRGLLNESRQAPMSPAKARIDNKYPPEIMNNDRAIINGTLAQLNRPFIKQTHTRSFHSANKFSRKNPSPRPKKSSSPSVSNNC